MGDILESKYIYISTLSTVSTASTVSTVSTVQKIKSVLDDYIAISILYANCTSTVRGKNIVNNK